MTVGTYVPTGPIDCPACGWRGYVNPVWRVEAADGLPLPDERGLPCCSRACAQTVADRILESTEGGE